MITTLGCCGVACAIVDAGKANPAIRQFKLNPFTFILVISCFQVYTMGSNDPEQER